MDKYSTVLNQINGYLEEFNSFLIQELAFKLFNLELIDNQDIFLCINDKQWEDIQFPSNRLSAGVYLYFATSKLDPNNHLIYIGKASFKRGIGLRLYDHFRDRFKYDNFIEVYKGGKYKIEMITSIAVPNEKMDFLAPALEEFLIDRCKRDAIQLSNKIGVK